MSLTIYRVCRRIYAGLDGEGAQSGRTVEFSWSPGCYMAQSVALAILENLVHMSRQDYPTGYVVVAATVPDHVRILDHFRYVDLRSLDADRERKAGDDWLQSRESAVLQVPSAVVSVIGTTSLILSTSTSHRFRLTRRCRFSLTNGYLKRSSSGREITLRANRVPPTNEFWLTHFTERRFWPMST
jgi:RES domain-containing protein